MNARTRRAAALLAASIAAVAALAAPGAARAETLAEAWALALERDHGLAAARAEAGAARLETDAARAARWPTVSVTGAYLQLDDAPAFDFGFAGLGLAAPELFEDDRVVTGAATLTVPLWTSGRITAGIAAARAHERGGAAQADAVEAGLRLAVAEAYVAVLRARRAEGVARSSVASLESLLGDVSSLYERELVPRNELLAAEVALADARQSALRAKHAAEVALAAYNRRLGVPMDRAVELEDAVGGGGGGLDRPLAALTAQALARRAELAGLGAQAEAYAALARGERARVLPQVALSGGYRYLGNQFLDDQTVGMAGVGVQWSVFDGGQAQRRAAALERRRSAAEQRRAEAASLIELEVRAAWLGRIEARERVQVTAGAVAQAEEALRIARERYGAGLGTQTQLLEAETLRVQALRNRDDAALDAGLAELRLARAVGEP